MGHPDPIAFTIAGIEIRWYGILIAAAMMLAVIISSKRAPRHGLHEEDVLDLALWMLPAGVIGARVYYVIFNHDMYHSVGVDGADHQFWDVPEKQDQQVPEKGGPDRVVHKGIGTNDAGLYIATLANVAAGWRMYDTNHYADSLLDAAIDIYKNVLKPNYSKGTTGLSSFYADGNSNYFDEAAAAAVALWYATEGKDTTYAYDLYRNMAINDNSDQYQWDDHAFFKAGYLGHKSGFYPGGWMTDYENVFAYVLFSMAKLILPDAATASKFGVRVDPTYNERDTLFNRVVETFIRLTVFLLIT